MSKKYVVKKRVSIKKLIILVLTLSLSVIGVSKIIKGIKKDSDLPPIKKIETKPTNSSSENSKNVHTVVIDPSFGGSDGGSKGYNGIIQKDINLGIALKIKNVLERHKDIKVILTRDKDETVSMEDRVKTINNSRADLLVSIMQNSEGSGDVSGVETYVLPKEEKNSNISFGYTLQQAMTMYVYTKDRGVLARNMSILKDSIVPGAVVNTGFITNKKEGTNLASEKYQLRMAEGIAQGIISYIDKNLKE